MGISIAHALDCFHSNDLIGIGLEADAMRRSHHPEGVVSYLVDRRIRIANSSPASELAAETIYTQASESLDCGATGLHLELVPTALPTLEQLVALISGLRQRHPEVRLHGFLATAIVALAEISNLTPGAILTQLRDAGLDSLAGDDALVATDADQPNHWFEIHRTAHQLGLRSTAAMVFGLTDTAEQRVQHLHAIHALQQETAGFLSFTPIAFHPDLYPGHVIPVDWQPPTAVEYLRTLAICRMLLDNITHIQSSSAARSLKVAQMTLRFGSNDLGSITLDDASRRSPQRVTEEDLRRVIRDAGFRPAQRDTLYRTMFLNH